MGDSVVSSFDEMTAVTGTTETVLTGDIRDQAQLHGLLQRVELLGLELVEVRQVGAGVDPHD